MAVGTIEEARKKQVGKTRSRPATGGVGLTWVTGLLVALGSIAMVLNANAAVDLGSNGVGYSGTVIPPSGMNATYLADMISFYNTGSPSSVTLGSGNNQASYSFTKDQGTLTPATLPAPASPPIKINSEVTTFTGQGTPSGTINLGSGGFDYIIAQWDGPNGVDAVYYIRGLSGVITINNKDPIFGPGTGYGLSGFWLGGDSTIPSNPNQNLVFVPESNFGLASGLLVIAASGWILLRRKQLYP